MWYDYEQKVTLKHTTEVKPMYMDCEIEIPDVPGKINQVKKVQQNLKKVRY